MTISKDLLLAILSLDSYNRGYNAGISDMAENDPDGLGELGQIGNAIIQNRQALGIDAAAYEQWQAAGFYAISYTIGAGVDGLDEGSSVISYRGTDDFATEFPLTDFPLIIGDYDEPSLSYSTQFFKSVEATADPESKLILTGHSLGGGLPLADGFWDIAA